MAYHDSTNDHRNIPNQQSRAAVGPYFRYDAVTPRWAMEPSSSLWLPPDDDDADDKENLFSPEHALPASLAFLNSSNIIEDSDEENDESIGPHLPSLAGIFSSDLVEDKIVDSRGFHMTIKPPPGMDHARSVVHRTSTLRDDHRLQQQHHQPYATALTAGPYRPPHFRHLSTARTTSSVSALPSTHNNGQQKRIIKTHTASLAATSTSHGTHASSSHWAFRSNNNDNNDINDYSKQRRNKKVSQKDLLQQYDRLSVDGARKMKPSAVQLRQASGPYQVKLLPLGQVRPHPLPPAAKKQPILIIPSSFDDEEGEWPRGATVTLEGSTAILQHHQDYPNHYEKEQDALVPKRLEFTQQLEPQVSFLDAMRAGLKLDHSPYRRKLTVPERHGRFVPKTTAAVVSPPRTEPIILVDYQSIRDCSMSGEKDAAERSEFLLRQMIDNHARGISGIAPDGGAFNSVLHAYARQGNPVKAEQVLDLMWKDFKRGNGQAEPNKRVYTTVMYAWEKSNKKYEAPEACEQLLLQMHELYESGEAPNCKPDLFAYTCILHCWADSKRKDAAARAEKLFKVMKIRLGQGDEDLRPDTICYSNLINVFLSCGQQISRAEATFWEMVESAISGQNKSAPPTTRNFNTILSGWSKSAREESPERVERILRRWQDIIVSGELNEDIKPDTYSYSLLLKTWAKSKRQDSLQKLMVAFDWIKRLYQDGDSSARMDTIKYATIIGALTHAKKPERAQEVLLEMVNDHYKNGNSKAKPDAKAFHSVLACWARPNGRPTMAVQQADNLLRRLWSLFEDSTLSGNADNNLRPSTWTYNTVIFCHKNANDPTGAESLLNEMDDMVKAQWMKKGPDETTFQVVHDCWKQSASVDKFQRMRDLKKEAVKRFGKELST